MKFALARRSSKAAIRKRQKRIAELQTHGMFAVQLFQRNPIEERVTSIESSPDHLVVGIGKTGIVEPHQLRETAEDFGVGKRFSWSFESRARQLQMVVAIGEIQ